MVPSFSRGTEIWRQKSAYGKNLAASRVPAWCCQAAPQPALLIPCTPAPRPRGVWEEDI